MGKKRERVKNGNVGESKKCFKKASKNAVFLSFEAAFPERV
jgi:hypothetical protein